MFDDIDLDLFSALVDQLDTAVSQAGGLGNTAQWIVENTAHPSQHGKPFSWKEHEYAVKIVNDARPVVAVRKATQIGCSEAQARQALAMSAKLHGSHIIYVLPSLLFAQKFAATRIDPIIDNSRRLKSLCDRTTNSTSLKKIGSSFLYLGGAAKEASAISVPAKALFVDELAFCDPRVISVYASRLGHTTDEDKYKYSRYFSSPLHPGSDISIYYEMGDQNIYMCYHSACGQWVEVDPLEAIKIPGFDDHLTSLHHSDLENPKIKISSAVVLCPHCRQAISHENLCNPDYRAWVPRYPGREVGSYDAGPFCLPTSRTPQAIVESLKLYRSNHRWRQYGLGIPAEAASELILESSARNSFKVRPQSPSTSRLSAGVLGSDVGKILHVCVGQKVGRCLEIVWMDQIQQTGGNEAGDKVVKVFEDFDCVQGAMDAGPDISLPRYVRDKLPIGKFWGVYFVKTSARSTLSFYSTSNEENIVKVQRTLAFDTFVAEFNEGKILLPMGLSFEEQVISHLRKLKRVTEVGAEGDEKSRWVTSDPANHWFFSIFYCWVASQMAEDMTVLPIVLPSGIGRIRMQTAA